MAGSAACCCSCRSCHQNLRCGSGAACELAGGDRISDLKTQPKPGCGAQETSRCDSPTSPRHPNQPLHEYLPTHCFSWSRMTLDREQVSSPPASRFTCSRGDGARCRARWLEAAGTAWRHAVSGPSKSPRTVLNAPPSTTAEKLRGRGSSSGGRVWDGFYHRRAARASHRQRQAGASYHKPSQSPEQYHHGCR